MLSIGILKEEKKENKVFIVPETVSKLISLGFNIYIENNAGLLSGFKDELYIKSGAVIENKNNIFSKDIILVFNFINFKKLCFLKLNCKLICFNISEKYKEYLHIFKEKKVTLIVLNNIPRLSKYQYMDIVSSISYISGYRAVVEALYLYKSIFSNQIVFSGIIPAVKVLIIGVGVSGLSSMSLLKTLGADIYAYDIRKETEDQVKSLGAKFIKINNLYIDFNDYLLRNIMNFNLIIITVSNKNNNLFKYITNELFMLMDNNSIIVDLSVKSNIYYDLEVYDSIYELKNGIKVISYYDYSRLMPKLSSFLCSNNLFNFLKFIFDDKKKKMYFNFNDVMINDVTLINNGIIYKKKIINEFKSDFLFKNKQEQEHKLKVKSNFFYLYKYKINKFLFYKIFTVFFFVFLSFFFLNYYSLNFFNNLNIFILSFLLGYKLINNIDHSLHTPLISLTNAISGIIFVGCLIQVNYLNNFINKFISFISLFLVSINVFSGFYITIRMLKMFNNNN